MTKQEFIFIYVRPYLTDDKARNRALWSDQIDFCIKSGLLPERAGNWTKEPKKYFGEVRK